MSTTTTTTDAADWDAPAEETKRVKCIVHTRPHTDTKGLNYGEEADVPLSVAKVMLDRGQVVLV